MAVSWVRQTGFICEDQRQREDESGTLPSSQVTFPILLSERDVRVHLPSHWSPLRHNLQRFHTLNSLPFSFLYSSLCLSLSPGLLFFFFCSPPPPPPSSPSPSPSPSTRYHPPQSHNFYNRHRLPGECNVRVPHNACFRTGCTRQATYGSPEDSKPVSCTAHHRSWEEPKGRRMCEREGCQKVC
jgi:hypothetical protein